MILIEKETKEQYVFDFKRSTGEETTICPICSQDRKKKNNRCFSFNHDKQVGNCAHCGKSFYSKIEKVETKKYTIPVINNTGLSEKALKWFNDVRKISKATIIRFNLSESAAWMPQKQKEVNTIQFNYYLNSEPVNVKFRDAEKNFKLVSGAKLIFYNLDAVADLDSCIICEGEIDCLSFYESGIYNSISVPNGASKGNQRLEYLDNCFEYFENKSKIILATDNDAPGLALREELARRLGKERCWIMPYPNDCKDINDVLVKYGPDVVNQCYSNIYEYPLEGVKTVIDFEDQIDNLYLNGYPEGLKVGFEEFDKLMSFAPGQFTVITGIPGSGKSEFTDQILVKLAELHGWKVGVYSAENQPEYLHFSKLAEKYIGKTFYTGNKQFQMSTDDLLNAKQFINNNFYFVEIKEENLTLDGLLAKAKELVQRKGINIMLIDPWNYIEHKIPNGQTETQYISEALTKVCNTCKLLNLHIIIVAHPTKIQKDKATKKYNIATLYDIAGSANWFNKCDNGISVYRDFETNDVVVYIQKIRFRWVGKIGFSTFTWDRFTGIYKELQTV